METNDRLWIAKFPARDDTRDVGAWEGLAQKLAARAGIEVPASELRRFSGEYHTFCVQRFDRAGGTTEEFKRAAQTIGQLAGIARFRTTVSSPFIRRNPRRCTLFGRVVCQQTNVRAVRTHDGDLSVWLER